jgi:hypothetical protein
LNRLNWGVKSVRPARLWRSFPVVAFISVDPLSNYPAPYQHSE